MKKMAPLVLLAMALPFIAAAAPYLRYSIGGTPLVLAYPDGYVELCSGNRSVAEDFKQAIPAENSLLGCYTTPKDLAELNNAQGGVFSTYLITSIMRGTVRGGTTAANFATFKSQLKEVVSQTYEGLDPEFKKRLKDVSGNLSDKYKAPLEVKSEGSVPLGVFDESDQHISCAWLAKSKYLVGDKETTSTQVQISTSVLANGRVFVLSTYGEYTNNGDIVKYENVAKSWTVVFLVQNQ